MCMSLKTRELGGIRCQKTLMIILFDIDHHMMHIAAVASIVVFSTISIKISIKIKFCREMLQSLSHASLLKMLTTNFGEL